MPCIATPSCLAFRDASVRRSISLEKRCHNPNTPVKTPPSGVMSSTTLPEASMWFVLGRCIGVYVSTSSIEPKKELHWKVQATGRMLRTAKQILRSGCRTEPFGMPRLPLPMWSSNLPQGFRYRKKEYSAQATVTIPYLDLQSTKAIDLISQKQWVYGPLFWVRR